MLRAEELRDRLLGMHFEADLATDLAEVTEKAEQYHRDGQLRALVGIGGDGTAAELVNRTSPGVPVTLLAAGTANLIAKYLKLGRTPQKLADQIAAGHLLQLDAGRVTPISGEERNMGRLFLVMLGCGLDADVVQRVHSHREERYQSGSKRGAHISYLSYIKPIMRTIGSYDFPEISVEVLEGGDETAYEQKRSGEAKLVSPYTLEHGRWVFVFNLPCYGWGLPLVPKAVGTDGKFDHCIFDGKSFWHGFKYAAFGQCGSLHRKLSDTRLGQGTKYRLTTSGEVPFQIDGDPGGKLPVEVEMLEKRFTVLVPESVKSKM
jgi:diacylglycerol kinase family enzyme